MGQEIERLRRRLSKEEKAKARLEESQSDEVAAQIENSWLRRNLQRILLRQERHKILKRGVQGDIQMPMGEMKEFADHSTSELLERVERNAFSDGAAESSDRSPRKSGSGYSPSPSFKHGAASPSLNRQRGYPGRASHSSPRHFGTNKPEFDLEPSSSEPESSQKSAAADTDDGLPHNDHIRDAMRVPDLGHTEHTEIRRYTGGIGSIEPPGPVPESSGISVTASSEKSDPEDIKKVVSKCDIRDALRVIPKEEEATSPEPSLFGRFRSAAAERG